MGQIEPIKDHEGNHIGTEIEMGFRDNDPWHLDRVASSIVNSHTKTGSELVNWDFASSENWFNYSGSFSDQSQFVTQFFDDNFKEYSFSTKASSDTLS